MVVVLEVGMVEALVYHVGAVDSKEDEEQV